MYKKGDFHIHTNASDGRLSPSEVVAEIKSKALDIAAVTDHDTTNGTNEAMEAGNRQKIKIIPGIELSTLYNNESIHILGYFKDDKYKTSAFQDFLKDMANYRKYRAKKIVENLDRYFNIRLNYEKILHDTEGVIARPHIARAIIENGYHYDWSYIFDNILNKESPAYVPNKKVTTEEGIKLLKDVNAFVSLAHPILIKKSPVEELLKFNFDGIEAIYSLNNTEQTETFVSLAKKHNLIVTAGSDFHGLGKSDTKHGIIGATPLQESNLKLFLDSLGIDNK